jgi:hypothetical protein
MDEKSAKNKFYAKGFRSRNSIRQVTVLLLFTFVTLALSQLWWTSTESMRPHNFTDSNWRNGISLRSESGFFTPYSEQTWQIAQRSKNVQFAKSGSRPIDHVEKKDGWINIYVKGAALNPEGDGYPNRVLLRSVSDSARYGILSILKWVVGLAFLGSVGIQVALSASAFNLVWVFVFTALISLPVLNEFAKFIPEAELQENRVLAALPEFAIEHPEQFALQYNKYFNEHFSLRNNLVRFNAWVKWRLFGSSPINSIIVGKDGETFYHSDVVEGNQSIANFCHRAQFSRAKLEGIWELIQKITTDLNRRNIGFSFMITPDKPTVFAEKMPDYFTISKGPTIVDQIVNVPKRYGTLPIIDLRRPLQEANRRHRVYYQNGTHWNDYGALIGYLEFYRELTKTHRDLPLITEADFDVTLRATSDDNMFVWVGLHREVTSIEPYVTPKASIATQQRLPKVFVFYDSFYSWLKRYLEMSFENVQGTPHGAGFVFDSSLIEREKPTHVILEVTERFLENTF